LENLKFSVAVPSLNQGVFLRQCLQSIEAQSYRNFEVLIADGGSQDGSLEIITDFVARDARFKLISRNDEGQANGIHKAFSCAVGDIFCYLNADDSYVRSDALALVANVFASSADVGFVTGLGVYVNHDGTTKRRIRTRLQPRDGLSLMRWRTALIQPATFWQKDVMTQLTLRNDAEYSFDSWFFYDAWNHGHRFVELGEEIAGYRLHGENKSLRISGERVLELARFEDHKFGPGSYRGRYLRVVAKILATLDRAPTGARHLKRALRFLVNGLSYVTVYRLPGV
jgi:glycosyltransferase involved in cell wall biosynthesis